ncbi:MAG: DEDD exonuclease domain-containing protein, partial [Demequina sp.]
IEVVLPSFLEFLGDAVLVAHNAPFDVGFLKAAYASHDYPWRGNDIVDTVTLARRVTTKEEAPNKKLATLARVFGSTVEPNHRALEDARATAQVMHGMFERLARWGITHREDLDTLRNPVPERLRRKAVMADALAPKPGVYIFRGPRGEALYVGTSTNVRARVKSYFNRGEQRRRMRDMVELAVAVDAIVCPTTIAARVEEVRQIAALRPRFNRRSTRPERTVWLRLTDEPHPRVAITRSVDGRGAIAGPMRGTADALAAIEVVHHALGVRTCTTRLPVLPRADARACLLKDLGACAAPCVTGPSAEYSAVIDAARQALSTDPSPVVAAIAHAVAHHAGLQDFERAGTLRDGLSALVEGATRGQRLNALRRCRIVAVQPNASGWELVSVAYGVFAGSWHAQPGDVWDTARALREDWPSEPAATAGVEEREMLARWLETPFTRLLYVDGTWASPVGGAGRHVKWVEARQHDHSKVADLVRGDLGFQR